MVGDSAASYMGLLGITNIGFSLVVLAIVIYYVKARGKLDELSRRFLIAGLFLGVHELTFFLKDDFIYELTKTLFFIALFYSLVYIVRHNTATDKKLEDQESSNSEMKKRMEELKNEIA